MSFVLAQIQNKFNVELTFHRYLYDNTSKKVKIQPNEKMNKIFVKLV